MPETIASPRHVASPNRLRHPLTTTPTTKPPLTPFLSSSRAHSSRPSSFRPPSSSPNYFNFQVDGSSYVTDSPQHAKNNWSPPSSSVRSSAAISPSAVPLDQNPNFDAFRRESEGRGFNLGDLDSVHMNGSNPRAAGARSASLSIQATSRPRTRSREQLHANFRASLDPSTAELSRSPKRVLSPGSATESPRRASPPRYTNGDDGRSNPKDDDAARTPRFELPLDSLNGMYGASKQPRSETMPAPRHDGNTQVLVTPQYVVNLMESKPEQILLLDLRVASFYASAHIMSSLNLCIPTTLLKRPSFNVRKLANTFKDEEQKERFENWENSRYIIVYDSNSAALKDCPTCLNTINKFRSEGYSGTLYIVKGGFNEFSQRFPSYVEKGTGFRLNGVVKPGIDCDVPDVAPVVGGCPMPLTDNPANPFFGNIRQNMDLIGGVGQIPIKHPSKATKSVEDAFPEWLKEVVDEEDSGKIVSKRFEQIERREKKRMEDALSGKVSWGGTPKATPGSGNTVQIAGLEKGSKNRYNNIWPFEHSRVKLQGVPSHGCDYFNASFIKAAWSNKRYISTQAPIPATFNDFWNVVWQQDVRVIVMLTAEKEGAQVKAHNYWEQKHFGPLHLDFLSEKRASLDLSRIRRHQKRPSLTKRAPTTSVNPQIPLATIDSSDDKNGDQPYVSVRKFTLSHERHPFEPMREITQLQYSNWPDFGAPAHPTHLLGLVEQCDAVVRSTNKSHTSGQPEPPTTRPILVHCSAGCGRTGTFCTVDTVIDMLKRQRVARNTRQATPMEFDSPPTTKSKHTAGAESSTKRSGSNNNVVADNSVDGAWVLRSDQDLVEKTVEDFRRQRLSMVQSLRQYVLCYESVMEWLVDH